MRNYSEKSVRVGMQGTIQIWNLHTGKLESGAMRNIGVNGVGVCHWMDDLRSSKKIMIMAGLDNRMRVYL